MNSKSEYRKNCEVKKKKYIYNKKFVNQSDSEKFFLKN